MTCFSCRKAVAVREQICVKCQQQKEATRIAAASRISTIAANAGLREKLISLGLITPTNKGAANGSRTSILTH